MAMTVEIKDNKLCIEIDLEKPTPSASGKTLVVASTRGNAVTKEVGIVSRLHFDNKVADHLHLTSFPRMETSRVRLAMLQT
jgi:hypothetical protein